MAENAANFTSTYQKNPSIFEVIAQKSLNDTLHPALEKVALVLATNYPHRFRWLNNFYEETFLILNGLLQYHYLKYYDASFSENFYGLKRISANNKKLTRRHKELSLIFLVVLPYFKKKFENKISVMRIEQAEGSLRKDFEGRSKKVILFLHFSFQVIWGLIKVQNYINYMASKIEFQTPLLRMMDIKLTYNMESQENNSVFTIFQGNSSLSQLSFGLIKNAITTSLEVTAFFLQFLHTWTVQKSNFSITDLPAVPPPPVDGKSSTFQGKCPICQLPWVIPTVLQVSGYIYCFRCILKFLNEHQKCPVTNLPAKPLDVIRLYM